MLTHAGLIGLNGLNSAAIGVCCNTLKQLANCRDGLPVACVVRGVLRQETAAAAVDFLATQPLTEFALALFNLNAFLYVD